MVKMCPLCNKFCETDKELRKHCRRQHDKRLSEIVKERGEIGNKEKF